MKKKPSIWDLIKYIICWFIGRRNSNKDKESETFKDATESLKKDYEKIDKKKEKRKKDDFEDRLDNMF